MSPGKQYLQDAIGRARKERGDSGCLPRWDEAHTTTSSITALTPKAFSNPTQASDPPEGGEDSLFPPNLTQVSTRRAWGGLGVGTAQG